MTNGVNRTPVVREIEARVAASYDWDSPRRAHRAASGKRSPHPPRLRDRSAHARLRTERAPVLVQREDDSRGCFATETGASWVVAVGRDLLTIGTGTGL